MKQSWNAPDVEVELPGFFLAFLAFGTPSVALLDRFLDEAGDCAVS